MANTIIYRTKNILQRRVNGNHPQLSYILTIMLLFLSTMMTSSVEILSTESRRIAPALSNPNTLQLPSSRMLPPKTTISDTLTEVYHHPQLRISDRALRMKHVHHSSIASATNPSSLHKLMNQRRREQTAREGKQHEQLVSARSLTNNQFSRRHGLPIMDVNTGPDQQQPQQGRSLVLGNMIEELSSVLHENLVGTISSVNPKFEGRDRNSKRRLNIRKKNGRQGGGNDYYKQHPNKQQLLSLPECATQQVCNAVYVRLNMTQPLCSCPSLTEPCSASAEPNDQHTIELKMGTKTSTAVTMIKTCEPVWSVRDCRAPRDWSILALQNTRTGKAHYLVICKCPDGSQLDGPLNHDQPSYAQVPGIRVYGMMCISAKTGRRRGTREAPEFPWWRLQSVLEDSSVLTHLLSEEDHDGQHRYLQSE